METVIYTLTALLAAYLYIDKFLLKGQLGKLFLQGWRELLGITPSTDEKESPRLQNKEDPEETRSIGDPLIEEKRYVEGPAVPADAKGPKTVPEGVVSDTFTSANEDKNVHEVLEWRAPSFPRRTTAQLRKRLSMRWEDTEFSARFVERDNESGEVDIVEIPDPEEIRREVAARIELIREDEWRAELEPTDEERYGLDSFNAEAYQ